MDKIVCKKFSFFLQIVTGSVDQFLLTDLINKSSYLHLFHALGAFWFLKKNTLRKNCVSGTVLISQLTWNSPTKAKVCINGNCVKRGLGYIQPVDNTHQ